MIISHSKASFIKKYTEETLPRYLGNLEKLAGDKGYFVADQVCGFTAGNSYSLLTIKLNKMILLL